MNKEDYPFLNVTDQSQVDEALQLFEEEFDAFNIRLRVVNHSFENNEFFIEDPNTPVLGPTGFGSYYDHIEEQCVLTIPSAAYQLSHDAVVNIVAHELGHIVLGHCVRRYELFKRFERPTEIEMINNEFDADEAMYLFLTEELMWHPSRIWDSQRAVASHLEEEIGRDHLTALFWVDAPSHPAMLKRWMSLISVANGTGSIQAEPDPNDPLEYYQYSLPDFLVCEHPTTWAGWEQFLMNKNSVCRLPDIGTEDEAHTYVTIVQTLGQMKQMVDMMKFMGYGKEMAVRETLNTFTLTYEGPAKDEIISSFCDEYDWCDAYLHYTYYRNDFEGVHVLVDAAPMVADQFIMDAGLDTLLGDDDCGCQSFTEADIRRDLSDFEALLTKVAHGQDETLITCKLSESDIEMYEGVVQNLLKDYIDDDDDAEFWEELTDDISNAEDPWDTEELIDEARIDQQDLDAYLELCGGVVVCEGCYGVIRVCDGESLTVLNGWFLCDKCCNEKEFE